MIRDFPCTHLTESVEVLLEHSALSVPAVHTEADAMAAFALEVREKTRSPWCVLPFCHTVEVEALGAKVRYGDRKSGPRVAEYACRTIDDLLALPVLDPAEGRIAQVLEACRMLHEGGEQVVLEITGPFTLLGGLIDPAALFRALRKEPEKMETVFAHLQRCTLTYMQAAERCGASIISYADPTGGVNIIGPVLAERVAQTFTLPLLRAADRNLQADTLVHLCPKTAFVLQDTGLARNRRIDLSSVLDYGTGCCTVRGQVRFVGHGCIKNHKLQSDHLFGLSLL